MANCAGVEAFMRATGQSTSTLSATVHFTALQNNQYRSLTTYKEIASGDLQGEIVIEFPDLQLNTGAHCSTLDNDYFLIFNALQIFSLKSFLTWILMKEIWIWS
jgi:hydroxymethylglutaryl-CoA reductase